MMVGAACVHAITEKFMAHFVYIIWLKMKRLYLSNNFMGQSNLNDFPETPDKMHFKYDFRNATQKDPGRRV